MENNKSKKIALEFISSITYEDLKKKVEEYEGILSNQGIKENMMVSVQVPPSYTFIYLILALWKLNAKIMLLDSRLTDAEVDNIFKKAKPNYKVSSLTVDKFFREEIEITLKFISNQKHSEQAVLYQTTSGSTGNPKIVKRDVDSIIQEIKHTQGLKGGVNGNDITLVLAALSHTYGFITGILQTLYCGGTLTFSETNQSMKILHTLHKKKVTVIFGVPFHYQLLAAVKAPEFLPSLRLAVSAGDKLMKEICQEFKDKFGVSIGQQYGMTEVGIISVDLFGENTESVGSIIPNIIGKIIDGELYIKLSESPYLYDGNQRYINGWFKTNDCVKTNSGQLYIEGRKDNLVNIGGSKVYVTEIENIIKRYKNIEDVIVTIEEGHPPKLKCYIVTSTNFNIEDFYAWCRTNIADYKIPNKIEVVKQLLKTSTGKIIRVQNKGIERPVFNDEI